MNIEEKDIDLIEQYLEGTLSEEDLRLFSNRISQDEEFRSTLEEMETMVSGIRYSGRRQVLNRLEELEANLPEVTLDSQKKIVPMYRRTWFAAAASVLIIALSAVWMLTGNQPDHQDLFNSYYTPYLNVVNPTLRADQPNNIPVRDQAYQAYDRQEYQKAIDAFLSIPENEKAAEDQLYLGISYLSLQNSAAAVPVLEQYIGQQEQFSLQATWYLALAHVALDQPEKAIPLLTQVAVNEGFKAVEAKDLIKKLN